MMNTTDTAFTFTIDDEMTPPTKPSMLKIMITVVMAIAGGFIVTANSLIVHIYRSNKSLHTSTFQIVASLAIADIITGFSIPGSKIWEHSYEALYHKESTLVHRKLQWFCLMMPTAVSRTHILLVAIERLLSAKFPIFHRLQVTRKKCAIILIIVWTFNFLICVAGFPLKEGTVHVYELSYVITVGIAIQLFWDICIFCFYIQLIRASTKQVQVQEGQTGKHQIKKDERSRRLTRLISITVVVFEVCWVPFIIIFGIDLLLKQHRFDVDISNIVSFFAMVAFSNSGVNIFIYAGINTHFKQALKRIVGNILPFVIKTDTISPMTTRESTSHTV